MATLHGPSAVPEQRTKLKKKKRCKHHNANFNDTSHVAAYCLANLGVILLCAAAATSWKKIYIMQSDISKWCGCSLPFLCFVLFMQRFFLPFSHIHFLLFILLFIPSISRGAKLAFFPAYTLEVPLTFLLLVFGASHQTCCEILQSNKIKIRATFLLLELHTDTILRVAHVWNSAEK